MNSEGTDRGIPARLNAGLAAGIAIIGVFQLLGVPFLIANFGFAWALPLVPCILSTTTHWALIHEAIHRLLQRGRANDLWGRALSILFGAPFESLRFPHLLHHHMNGMTADRPEYFDSARTGRALAALVYYPKLLFGIYVTEIASTFMSFLPRTLLRRIVRHFPRASESDNRAELYLLESRRLAELRTDSLAIVALYATAFWLYGRFWPLLVLAIVARGVLVSVADNAYHYGAPLGAGSRSAYNLRLGSSAAILNFNLHQIHHLHPNVPWIRLPRAFESDGGRYHQGYLEAMLRQFLGPISDREYARDGYRPSNFGSRFAKNADTPSLTS